MWGMLAALPRRLFLVCVLVSTACQAVDGAAVDDVGVSSEAILGGDSPSPGQFPTVVGIVIGQGQGVCTGTFIAPDLILTAAHCISPQIVGLANQEQVTAATSVWFDTTFLGSGTSVAAADTIPHPSFNQPGDPDVGLIRLAQPRTEREPSPINLDPGAVPVGTTVDMVGYGVDDSGQAGEIQYLTDKTSVSCAASGFSDSTFICFNQQDGTGKCSGDSGGPSFLAGTSTVVGITSFGDQQCEFFGADMRTDASSSFLAENAPELGCSGDGVCDEDCDVDPDCDGAPGGLGSACGDGESCQVGFCAAGPGGMRCTIDCQPDDAMSCPEGFECLETNADSGACWPIDEDGGCNASGAGAGGFAWLLIGLAFALRRRRR